MIMFFYVRLVHVYRTIKRDLIFSSILNSASFGTILLSFKIFQLFVMSYIQLIYITNRLKYLKKRKLRGFIHVSFHLHQFILTSCDIIIGPIAQNTLPPPSPFSMLFIWEIILVSTAIVLYDDANDFSGQNTNIEPGVGVLQVNFSQIY